MQHEWPYIYSPRWGTGNIREYPRTLVRGKMRLCDIPGVQKYFSDKLYCITIMSPPDKYPLVNKRIFFWKVRGKKNGGRYAVSLNIEPQAATHDNTGSVAYADNVEATVAIAKLRGWMD